MQLNVLGDTLKCTGCALHHWQLRHRVCHPLQQQHQPAIPLRLTEIDPLSCLLLSV